MSIKEKAREEFDRKFPEISGANTIGTGDMNGYIQQFIDQSIDLAQAEERERIIKLVKNVNEFADSGDTLKQRIINLLDNK